MSVLIFILLSQCAWSNYGIKDLQALESRGEYREFFAHAKDVRPAKRDKAWLKMLSSMSELMLRDTLKLSHFDHTLFNLINDLSSWSELRDDYNFVTLRDKVFIEQIALCKKSEKEEVCHNLAKKFVSSHDVEAITAHSIGLELEGGKFDNFVFYSPIVKSNQAGFYCQREHILPKLIKRIYSFQNTKDIGVKNYIEENMHASCWKIVAKEMKSLYRNSGNQHAFKVLDQMDELTSFEKLIVKVNTLLDSPKPNHLQALDVLNQLGKDHNKRRKLIKAYNEYEVLPGRIFHSSQNDRRNLVLFKHLVMNFPEYLDFYSKHCIKQIEKSENYPRGKRALYCDEMFSLAKMNPNEVLPKPVVQKFYDLKSF